jgi:hemoglobin
MSSLFERIGGEKAVERAVVLFYGKVLLDPFLTHFFDSVDMEAQIHKQKEFLTMALGGPHNYTGRHLRKAHQHLQIQEEHFHAVIKHLKETLVELNIHKDDLDEIMLSLAVTHDDIVNA